MADPLVVHVTGADPTGQKDSAPAIQSALDLAASMRAAEKAIAEEFPWYEPRPVIVDLSLGDFKVQEALKLSKDVNLAP